MITIRNPMECQSRTVIAGEALSVGMCVYLAAPANDGDPCKVMKATATQTGDATVEKGIVFYVQDNDLAVDYILNPATNARTLNTGNDATTVIPSGALCTFWYDKPVVGYTEDSVDSSMDFASVGAGTKVAFLGSTSKLAEYLVGQSSGIEDYMGIIYEHDGAEITVMFTQF